MRGNATVTETSRPLFQLNPTCGLTPVACSTSASTALAYLNPSVTVLTASQAARLIVKAKRAANLNMGSPKDGANKARRVAGGERYSLLKVNRSIRRASFDDRVRER